MEDQINRLDVLKARIHTIMERLDIESKENEINKLEQETVLPGFWADQKKAQNMMRQISELKDTVKTWRNFEKRIIELHDLITISISEEHHSMESDFIIEFDTLSAQVDALEMKLALSGEYVKNSAILAIHAGAGGTESQDWAEMLMRMYTRWAERKNFQSEILKISPGDEAGIKSVMIGIKGNYAYGFLKNERGVHRLVRLSPYDADHSRHTSFALVEVLPEVEGEVEIALNPDDINIEVYRASGHGGQNVQKTSTAVRVTHIPSGIVVTCQDERSQFRNKEIALRILKARLVEVELKKKSEEQARLKGEHITAEWGNQIRSYVLHPYKLVKDHRTGYETNNPDAVLDGDLDDLLIAYLKSRVGD
ncbi:MAG: peptide chain release factor 2 [Chloroflexi bacterium]|nr:peptide chain release factor 2 [Chloroflexota bacterium]